MSPGFSHFSGRLQYYGPHLYNPVNGIQPPSQLYPQNEVAACNQLGYSSSTAYKIYVVSQEGHGPYAAIDCTSVSVFL